MKFEFSDYFSPFELFSAIVPGGIGTYIIWTLLQTSPISEQLPVLTGAGAWVAFVISSLILGYVVQPPSHILNIAYDSTYRAYRRRKGDPLLEFAQYQAVREIPTILETGGSVYEWAKTKIQATDPLIEKSIGTIQGISKLFRSLCLFSLIGLIVALWLNQWLVSCMLLGLAGLFFYIFCERRWAASCLVYQRLRDLGTVRDKKSKKQLL